MLRTEFAVRDKLYGVTYMEWAGIPLERIRQAISEERDPSRFEIVQRQISDWEFAYIGGGQ